ncbi:hypothetical protein CYY_004921 [Polysphondylium violaceum]|uniref:BSD domain-containing protein n=1 Tax=Polysphondylium violaceum TaxID=133409 RepID=A0A8J4V4Q6_9MYCE|nr:hypothetical protein CYY_004921 [Polysphondylium violaceum]
MEFHYESIYQKQGEEKEQQSNSSVDSTTSSSPAATDTFDLLSKSIPTISSWGWGSFSSIVDTVKQKSEDIINTYKEEIQNQQVQAQQESLNNVNVNLNQEDGIIIEEDVSDDDGGDDSLLTSPIIQNLSVLDIKNKISFGFSKFLSEFPSAINNDNGNNSLEKNRDNFTLNNSSSNSKLTTTTTSLTTDIDEKDIYFYSNDPENSLYKQFRESFKLLDYQSKITQLLMNNSRVSKSYLYLVPSKVLEFDFWSRHFFKEHLITLTEKALQSKDTLGDEDEITWDNDDDDDENQNKDEEIIQQEKVEAEIENTGNDIKEEEEEIKEANQVKAEEEITEVKEDIVEPVIKEEEKEEKVVLENENDTSLIDIIDQPNDHLIQYDPLTSFSNVNNNNVNIQQQQQQQQQEETLLQPITRPTPPVTPSTIPNNTIPKKLSMVELNDWEVLSDKKSDEEDWGAWE